MIVGSDGNDGDLMPALTNIETIRQQRCLEVASRPRHVLVQSMRRVGLIDITVGTAPRRIATFHHATLRVAPHRYATREPLGTPGGSRAFSADGHPQAPVAPRRSCAARTFLSPNPGRNASPICPDLIYDRHNQ